MTDRELMQQALDALDSDDPSIQLRAAVALRSRLYQLTTKGDKKLAILTEQGYTPCGVMVSRVDAEGNVQYGAVSDAGRVLWWPVEKTAAWVGLTDEDIARAGNLKRMLPYAYARAIEKLLRSKNGGAA